MFRCKHRAFLIYLLIIFATCSTVSCQNGGVEHPAEISDEDTIDLTPSMNLDSIPDKSENDDGADEIVGQALIPPIPGSTPGPFNLFSTIFPALNSLLLLSSLFPVSGLLGQAPPLLGQSLLGQAPPLLGQAPQLLGQSLLGQAPSLLGQAPTLQTDQIPSASKVVLVLAEDRNPHAAMRAANQEAARTIRQTDMMSQLLAQINQADLGQLLSQAFEPMQQQNSGQMSQLLTQMLQPIPGIDLTQMPLLGQALGQRMASSESTVDAALRQAGGAGTTAVGDATSASSQTFQIPNIQSAIDAGTQMLGQAFQQPNTDFNSAFQLSNIQSALDAGTQMLGQALQQANADTAGSFQLPNIQSVIDSGAQMLGQSGGLFNLRQLQPTDAASTAIDTAAAASDITEVRVKPDVTMTKGVRNQNEQQMPTTENMDEMKKMSAFHKALVQNKMPVLWFRTPVDLTDGKVHEIDMKNNKDAKMKSVEDLKMEAKLQAFQRQLVKELRLLQDIERQAKEMRAASKGVTAKTYKDVMNEYKNNLSKIPVHKITRVDIEKALNDEYVRKLLQKTAFGNMQEFVKMAYQNMHRTEGADMKRSTFPTTSTRERRQMSREEIIQLLAHAYRLANANAVRMLESAGALPIKAKEADCSARQMTNMGTNNRQMMDKMKSTMERQWSTDQNAPKEMTPIKSSEQSGTTMDKMKSTMERQWSTDPNVPKAMKPMGRESTDQQIPLPMPYAQQSTPMRPQSKQMPANSPMSIQQQQQQGQQQKDMPSESVPKQGMTSSAITTTEGRQWADQQQSSQKGMQQVEEKMNQQPRNQMQQQQQQQPVKIQDSQMNMQQPQVSVPETQTSMDMQQLRMTDNKEQQMLSDAAIPQMPEHNEKARYKVDDYGWGGPFGFDWGGPFGFDWGGGFGSHWGGPFGFDWGGPFGYDWGGGFGSNWHGKYSKKGHGGWPTYVNYFYNPGRSHYYDNIDTHSGYSEPSYGSGHAAPNTNAYRTAVGDEEIQAMLAEHASMATHFRK